MIAAPAQYLVSHGKNGALGVFAAPLALRRGARVVVRTPRGLEHGTVLGPATDGHAKLMGVAAPGELVRPLTAADETSLRALDEVAQQLFAAGRAWAQQRGLTVEVRDVAVLLDGRQAILQYVGTGELEAFAQDLEQEFRLDVRLESLTPPATHEHEEEHAGCDKPDCGRAAGGSCTTCSTGGGCSSCGSGKVDMRPYFAHLRDKMEATHRTPLV